MPVSERLSERASSLSPAERRVAEVVLRHPDRVAFGTCATVARQAATGGATVVRCAAKLGYRGFAELQSDVQTELSRDLAPAAERIREPGGHPLAGVLDSSRHAEVANVDDTLAGVDRGDFARAVRALARRSSRVVVVTGHSSEGIGLLLRDQLAMLRPAVDRLWGSPVRVATQLGGCRPGDVLVAIDVHRYDRSVLEAVDQAARQEMSVIAITDSPLSPLARRAEIAFRVAASSPGPFDSHTGELVVSAALVAGVARRLKTEATRRLDLIEAAWEAGSVLAAE